MAKGRINEGAPARWLGRILLMGLALMAPALSAPTLAAAPKPATGAAVPAPPVPALWEAQIGKSRAYLFGTVHSLPRGVDWFKPHVAQALDGSQLLVLETEIPDGAAGISPALMKLSRLPAARPVQERVPESWRPTLAKATNRLKLGPMEWNDTWFIALMLTNLQAGEDGLDPRIGVEAVLSERARIHNIPIKGLETVEEQLTNFDSLPEADQQMLLISTLADLDNSRANTSLLVGDWMLGNTDGLAGRINGAFERSPMLRQLLVEDRNIRWAQWLTDQMKAQSGNAEARPIFLAVGAGHLAGRGSLIDELEKRGVKVKRVEEKPVSPPARKRKRR